MYVPMRYQLLDACAGAGIDLRAVRCVTLPPELGAIGIVDGNLRGGRVRWGNVLLLPLAMRHAVISHAIFGAVTSFSVSIAIAMGGLDDRLREVGLVRSASGHIRFAKTRSVI